MENRIREMTPTENAVVDNLLHRNYCWINNIIDRKVFLCSPQVLDNKISIWGYFLIDDLMDRSNTLLDLPNLLYNLEFRINIENHNANLTELLQVEHPQKIEIVNHSDLRVGDRVITQSNYKGNISAWFTISDEEELNDLNKSCPWIKKPYEEIPPFIYDEIKFHNYHNLGALLDNIIIHHGNI